MKTGKSIRELVLERGLMDRDRLDAVLSTAAMTHGRIVGGSSLIALLLITFASDLGAQARRPKARLFPPEDLGLRQAPDRDQWQKPDQIMDTLGIANGSVVADLGAGGGWFTLRFARRVGPNGRVYAEDIQRQMLEALGRRVQRENLSNVIPVLGTATDPRLPPGLDAVLIVDAYHEMNDPVTLLRNVGSSLKSYGRLGVVDFNADAGGPGPSANRRVDPDAIIKAAAAAGFQLIAREAVVPFQFLLVFGRSAGARP